MVKKVVWTKSGLKSFQNIINYLEEEFGDKVTSDFVIHTHTVTGLLATLPQLGSLENADKKIRGFILSKHNKLFYRITDTSVIILNIFDTCSNPTRQKY